MGCQRLQDGAHKDVALSVLMQTVMLVNREASEIYMTLVRNNEGGVQLSGAKILTMQWMDGCKITDLEGLQRAKLRPRDVGNVLLDAFARMQYVEGWVHGDAHSGNLLVRPAQHQCKAPACNIRSLHCLIVVCLPELWD